MLGDALHVGERDLPQLIAVEEEEPPVADRGVLRERAYQEIRFELRALDVVQQPRLGARDFVLGQFLFADAVEHREQRLARARQIHFLA